MPRMQGIISPIEEVYKPIFDVPETLSPDLGSKKVGQKIKAIVNFTVIEKTKSYIILRVSSFYLVPSKRIY